MYVVVYLFVSVLCISLIMLLQGSSTVRKPNDKENILPVLVADLSVWQPQATTFFDVFSCKILHSLMSTPRNKTTHKLLKSSMHLLHHLS